jgi:hypothetical protein
MPALRPASLRTRNRKLFVLIAVPGLEGKMKASGQRPDLASGSPLVFRGFVHAATINQFSERVLKEVDTVWRTRGFASPTAFIRYAVKQELSEWQEGLTGAEERIAATLTQVRKDVFRVGRAQQALFNYIDTLAKALLTCVPEPPAEARPRAVACAKERYERLIRSAGRAMVGESKLAMEDLVGDLGATVAADCTF